MSAARRIEDLLEPKFVVTVPVRTIAEHNVSRHEKWFTTKKRVDSQHAATLLVLRTKSLTCPFDLPIRVTLTRLSSGRLDTFDNLPSSMKHVADMVAWWARGSDPKMKIGQADRDEHAIEFVAKQEKTKEGVFGVRIEIEEKR